MSLIVSLEGSALKLTSSNVHDAILHYIHHVISTHDDCYTYELSESESGDMKRGDVEVINGWLEHNVKMKSHDEDRARRGIEPTFATLLIPSNVSKVTVGDCVRIPYDGRRLLSGRELDLRRHTIGSLVRDREYRLVPKSATSVKRCHVIESDKGSSVLYAESELSTKELVLDALRQCVREIVELKPEFLDAMRFTLGGVTNDDFRMYNLIRASMFTFVPHVAIDTVEFHVNTTDYLDEVLATRLRQIPIVRDVAEHALLECSIPRVSQRQRWIFSQHIDECMYPDIPLLPMHEDQELRFTARLKSSVGLLDMNHAPCVMKFHAAASTPSTRPATMTVYSKSHYDIEQLVSLSISGLSDMLNATVAMTRKIAGMR